MRGVAVCHRYRHLHGVQVSSITPHLKALESARLITRQRDASDGRVHLIEITSIGAEALRRFHDARRGLLAGLVGDGIDTEQISVASAVLERVAHQLDHDSRPHSAGPHR
jgi:DNA-binding MarR family transcriptional regulator